MKRRIARQACRRGQTNAHQRPQQRVWAWLHASVSASGAASDWHLTVDSQPVGGNIRYDGVIETDEIISALCNRGRLVEPIYYAPIRLDYNTRPLELYRNYCPSHTDIGLRLGLEEGHHIPPSIHPHLLRFSSTR